MVSRRRLEKLKRLPKAKGRWFADSGGFTELSLHGEWTISVQRYIEEIRRYFECVGNLAHAAPMDWMAEPNIRQKTGNTVEQHQQATVTNFLDLKSKAPDLPWVPVLQGWTVGEYWDCMDLYEKAGVHLAKEPLVGLGSVCRRQATTRIGALIATLRAENIRVHTFGAKTRGLALFADDIVSSDSLAWSYNARRRPALPDCEGLHPSCQNCLTFALKWRRKVLALLGQTAEPEKKELQQGLLF